MALSPKWSEEARKNVKETNIDERMYERMMKQKERMAADRAAQKTQTPAPMPSIPSYPNAIRKQVVDIVEEPQKTRNEVFDDVVSEVCARIMVHVEKGVREELAKLVEEGRLD